MRSYAVQLVLHCGVSHAARGLVLESCAHSADYCSGDVRGLTPSSEQSAHCERLETTIDLQAVCDKINDAHRCGAIKLQAQVSCNAGRYKLIVI